MVAEPLTPSPGVVHNFRAPRCRSQAGKAEVCKTSTRRFKSGRHLRSSFARSMKRLRALWFGLVAWGCSGPPSLIPDGAALCGNGVIDVGEACDGGSIACATLGGSWSAGTAPCRTSCAGADVSMCTLRAPGSSEVVKPAQRDPTRWAQARCNDGTPFAFRISLAPTPSPVWVIQLE